MDRISLTEIADEQLAAAVAATTGRSARSVYAGAGRALRQTVLALRAGATLADHESPGEATLHVLRGRVRLVAGDDEWVVAVGDLVGIPPVRHAVEALEDSAVLLSVARPA